MLGFFKSWRKRRRGWGGGAVGRGDGEGKEKGENGVLHHRQ